VLMVGDIHPCNTCHAATLYLKNEDYNTQS
jgi:hypothetical protein